MEAVIRALVPFYLILVATMLVISYVPEISLFIPRQLGYLDR
jgi:TRAP-type C4-dicarboxylate transport system permease large subunit